MPLAYQNIGSSSTAAALFDPFFFAATFVIIEITAVHQRLSSFILDIGVLITVTFPSAAQPSCRASQARKCR
jgi:hypothetical protein